MTTNYIISDYRKDTKRTLYVCARPGYCRTESGEYKRDGSFKGGPEWSEQRDHAFIFKTCRSSMLVRNKCVSAKVHPILA